MCIPGSELHPNLCVYSEYFQRKFLLYLKTMSLQKKNVIQGFLKDEYVPTGKQYLVKYLSGKGNNLHEVICFDGTIRLVSMPKKYRQTVWLKKDDCLVIDPIEEGKKVTGEILCVLADHAVRDLITNRQWPSEASNDTDALLKFFDRNMEKQAKREEYNPFPSSDSSDVDTEEDEEEEDDDDEDGEEDEDEEENETQNNCESSDSNVEHHTNGDVNGAVSIQSNYSEQEVDDVTRDRNRSRVQLVTSGIVTVTNVLSEGFENDIQSLEFEADEEEESCDDDQAAANNRDIHRHANTIRIQVNYDNAN